LTAFIPGSIGIKIYTPKKSTDLNYRIIPALIGLALIAATAPPLSFPRSCEMAARDRLEICSKELDFL
jgi:hypothetical protein